MRFLAVQGCFHILFIPQILGGLFINIFINILIPVLFPSSFLFF